MFRIERSPDRPMFLEWDGWDPRGETVVCVGESIDEAEALALAPPGRARLEPDLAAALERCLSGVADRLMVDLEPLGPGALSALAHLRMLRPRLAIVVLGSAEEAGLLAGLPVEPVRRRRSRRRRGTEAAAPRR